MHYTLHCTLAPGISQLERLPNDKDAKRGGPYRYITRYALQTNWLNLSVKVYLADGSFVRNIDWYDDPKALIQCFVAYRRRAMADRINSSRFVFSISDEQFSKVCLETQSNEPGEPPAKIYSQLQYDTARCRKRVSLRGIDRLGMIFHVTDGVPFELPFYKTRLAMVPIEKKVHNPKLNESKTQETYLNMGDSHLICNHSSWQNEPLEVVSDDPLLLSRYISDKNNAARASVRWRYLNDSEASEEGRLARRYYDQTQEFVIEQFTALNKARRIELAKRLTESPGGLPVPTAINIVQFHLGLDAALSTRERWQALGKEVGPIVAIVPYAKRPDKTPLGEGSTLPPSLVDAPAPEPDNLPGASALPLPEIAQLFSDESLHFDEEFDADQFIDFSYLNPKKARAE